MQLPQEVKPSEVKKIVSCEDMADYYNSYKKKKRNGFRIISAPSEKLKQIQRKLAEDLYQANEDVFNSSNWITGFVPGKNIGDNAKPHLKSEWVVNLDIANFFPSVTEEDIVNAINTLPRKLFSLSGKTKFYDLKTDEILKIATLNGKLPQGSPASPVIANLAGIQIDTEVFLAKGSWVYTRYADDLTLSTKEKLTRQEVESFVKEIRNKIEDRTTYKIKDSKVNIKHRSQQQNVTGIVVNNEKLGLSYKMRNQVRAILHNHKLQSKPLDSSTSGLLGFIKQVNQEQYCKLTKEFPCNLLM